KVTSLKDTEHIQSKQPSCSTVLCANESKHCKSSQMAVPCCPMVGGARTSQRILAMQPSDLDKKRDAFLEHLKQKYPQHASIIISHQERLREQNRSARAGVACLSLVPVFSDQPDLSSLVSLDNLAVMSECEVPFAFTRGSRSRASLPVVRSANQTKDRSLGVLYLQYGDDTKQIRMPNEITTVDTVQALFVSAFPQQLSMKMLESPSTAIYVKDDIRNMYYELMDVRSITDQSCLKVYHKDTAHAFSHATRPSSGDSRMQREVMYTSRDAPLMRQTSNSSSMPSSPHSITSLPSRIPFGPRSSGGGATMPRERPGHSLATPTRSASPCSSAILERRDVKPDEDVSAKVMGRGGEGMYNDTFLIHHHAPLSETLDQGYHRGSLRAYGVPAMTMEPTEHHSGFRQKSWKTPPPSPHRMGEMRIIDIQASQSQGTLGLERSSPVRQSLRKEGPIDKGKNALGSPVTSDHGHGPLTPPGEPPTQQRMRAMEEQIASLSGLVHHALLMDPSIKRSDREHVSDQSMKSGSPIHLTSRAGGSSPVLGTKVTPGSNFVPTHSISTIPFEVTLLHFRKNVSGLRIQLQQLRQLQLQNQECMRAQIKKVEHEISARLAEALRLQEDSAQRQRALVEEERHKYLSIEETVLSQLRDLEQYVKSVRRDSSSATALKPITMKEVEEGAVGLRKVGESLAALKGEFPALQGRMRAVLRVEVEAVKFLKEEPHKLDSMLRRVKSLTETLSTLRRCATEGLLKSFDVVDETEPASPDNIHSTVTQLEPQRFSMSSEIANSQPLLPPCPSSFSLTPELHTKSTSKTSHVKICSLALPELTPSLSSSSEVALSTARCNESSMSGASSLFIEEIISQSKGKNRAPSIAVTEKEWEEKRQNMHHYDGFEFEKMLQEAEANMLKGTPSVDVEDSIMPSPAAAPPSATEDRVEKPKPSAPSVKEKANKSPPPPPPRRNYINSVGVTTTRSGEVVYTCKKECGSAQEGEFETPMQAPQNKPKGSPEVMPKLGTPLPVTAPAILEEEDDGEKIMAELQSTEIQEKNDMVMDENGNNTARQNTGVSIYNCAFVICCSIRCQQSKKLQSLTCRLTALTYELFCLCKFTQIPKEPQEESTDNRAASLASPSQVSHVNTYEKSQNKLLFSSDAASSIPNHGLDNNLSLTNDLPYKLTCSSPVETEEHGPGSPTQGKVHVVKVPQVQLSIEETVESPTAICTSISLGGPDLIYTKVPENHGELCSANQQQAISFPKSRTMKYEEVEDENETFLSPDLPGEEPPPPPPDNIAFMITNTKVQALTTGEYQELVNAKRGNVQTVTVGSKPQTKCGTDFSTLSCSNGFADAGNSEFSKKPVIIIFDEPMDIHSAYKRLSTIFECEDELERMLAEERIEEEIEETEDDDKRNGGLQVTHNGDKMSFVNARIGSNPVLASSLLSDEGTVTPVTSGAKQDVKKKFKFKFPKKQLAALTQAIRTGTKTGKKTLQVVVYEDDEESDGTIKHKETKRFEISCSKQNNPKSESVAQEPQGRTEEIRKSTYKTLDSLEQTIKQLETTISEMGPRSSEDLQPTEYSKPHGIQGAETLPKIVPQKPLVTKTSNSSKRPSLRKKPKPQLLPRPANVSVSLPTSRMPMPMSAKVKQQPGTSDKERAAKQLKMQDSQRQFRQVNGSAKRAGGDPKSTSPTIPASKIPAFSSSAGKAASQPDATNPVNHSAVSSSSSSSSKSSIPNHRSFPNSSSHIPSITNGSLKHAQSTHSTKSLSLSTQNQNGRYSSSSSSPSSLSPTMLSQVSKSIRTIHTPSFTSYSRPHNASAGKSAIPT
ncbi:sickle tail protein-like isoform X3, partial [Silurus asotus]